MTEGPDVAEFWRRKTYTAIWKDLKKAIERCHKDGTMKLKVAANPEEYIIYDPHSEFIETIVSTCH